MRKFLPSKSLFPIGKYQDMGFMVLSSLVHKPWLCISNKYSASVVFSRANIGGVNKISSESQSRVHISITSLHVLSVGSTHGVL